MVAVKAVMADATAQLRGIYRPGSQAAARARSAEDVMWYMALVDEKVVGALRYVVKPDSLHLGLGVIPDYQRQGVARALINTLAIQASLLGLRKLSLFTIKETGNEVIFARLGFRVVREEPAQDIVSVTGGPLTDVLMERPI
jgi:GNAT superfamily N-acetyltransferase